MKNFLDKVDGAFWKADDVIYEACGEESDATVLLCSIASLFVAPIWIVRTLARMLYKKIHNL